MCPRSSGSRRSKWAGWIGSRCSSGLREVATRPRLSGGEGTGRRSHRAPVLPSAVPRLADRANYGSARGAYPIRSSIRTWTVSPASLPIALRSAARTGSRWVPSPWAISAPVNGSPSIAPRIFTSPRVPNRAGTSSRTTHVHAPGLVDPAAVAAWRVPSGLRCEVHEFDARVGGAIRVSLTYDDPSRDGKSGEHTDTYRGRFVSLVPDELVVEADAFETDDPAMAGEMRITITLADAPGGGTELVAIHEGVPAGVRPADNEVGWNESLDRLAALVE
ncbi:MAG: SRPBCC domain-containing protein [Solirubrobacterales bacterium]|nr:SRPBCC domain-containing protein [Solirubrobacterales bacterium]